MDRKPVTLEDVAARSGVSRQTVSRAINGKADIRAETRDRVMAAVEELGYRPNLFARGLVTRRSQTIGLIVGDLTNPFFPDVARGVLDQAEANDLIVLVANLGQGWDTLGPLDALALRGVDGYILFPAVSDEEKIGAFANSNGPIVVVDAPFEHPAISRLAIDWERGGELVAEHLASTGRKRPCVITAPADQAADHRVEFFRSHAAARGIPIPDDAVAAGDQTIDGGRAAVSQLLAGGYDAVFAFNDLMAIGAMQVLLESGVSVPDQWAVVGCDDIMLAANVTPALTSIHLDRYEIGCSAMRLLLERLGESTDSPPANDSATKLAPVSLSVRASSGPPSPR